MTDSDQQPEEHLEPDEDMSAGLWAQVIIETLRLAAARGNDQWMAASRYFDALKAALDHDGGTKRAILAGHNNFADRVDQGKAWPDADWAFTGVADAGLRYLSERAALDPAARGRESRRRSYLDGAIRIAAEAEQTRRERFRRGER